jgi:hypothetical protein
MQQYADPDSSVFQLNIEQAAVEEIDDPFLDFVLEFIVIVYLVSVA